MVGEELMAVGKNINEMEKIRRTILIIGGILFILFFIYTFYLIYYGKKESIERQYSGIITEIRNLPGNRDIPDIKIDNQWIPLGIDDSKVKHYIQLGDSIVKESGSEIIEVYRKNLKGEWAVQIFK